MDLEHPPQVEVARHDAPERGAARHTLTVKQAAELFTQLGSPRSARSVQRFCEQKLIDAIPVTRDNGTPQYFIDPQSIERYAAELKQLQDISQIGNDITRHDTSERDTARHDAPKIEASFISEPALEIDDVAVGLRERVDTLEKENMQMKIDLGARVIVINEMATERGRFFDQVTNQSREIGRLEMQVQQLAAPKADATRHDAPDIVEVITTAIVEQGRGVADAEPAPAASAIQEPRPGFFRRVFGG
jgi:hypothetical protein